MRIEKGIVPPRRYLVYPFDKMKVNDSILIKAKDKEKAQRLVVSAARRYKTRHKNFTIQTQQVKNGVRIWRVS